MPAAGRSAHIFLRTHTLGHLGVELDSLEPSESDSVPEPELSESELSEPVRSLLCLLSFAIVCSHLVVESAPEVPLEDPLECAGRVNLQPIVW